MERQTTPCQMKSCHFWEGLIRHNEVFGAMLDIRKPEIWKMTQHKNDEEEVWNYWKEINIMNGESNCGTMWGLTAPGSNPIHTRSSRADPINCPTEPETNRPTGGCDLVKFLRLTLAEDGSKFKDWRRGKWSQNSDFQMPWCERVKANRQDSGKLLPQWDTL